MEQRKMGSRTAKSYNKEFKEQIIKECMETNKYNVVAKKHQVPVTTVYTWIKRDKNKSKTQKRYTACAKKMMAN